MEVSKEEISRVLMEFDIPEYFVGFSFLVEALSYMVAQENKPGTMKVYKHVADKFNTYDMRVERNIRRCIEKAWGSNKTNIMQQKYFKGIYGVNDYPRNGQFLQMMRTYLRSETFLKK